MTTNKILEKYIKRNEERIFRVKFICISRIVSNYGNLIDNRKLKFWVPFWICHTNIDDDTQRGEIE